MRFLVTIFAMTLGFQSFAMDSESVKIVLYKKGETLFGQDFMPASEAVVDYLATLPRPTEGLKGFVYQCNVKGNAIRAYTNGSGSSSTLTYVVFTMLYEVKDCVKQDLFRLKWSAAINRGDIALAFSVEQRNACAANVVGDVHRGGNRPAIPVYRQTIGSRVRA